MKRISKIQKSLIIAGILALLPIIFFGTGIAESFRINVSLTSNPSLSDGLVGYWTLDGENTLVNIADSSGQGSHGSLNGQVSTSTIAGRVGQGINFDGVDDYISVGDAGSGVKTISFWVKANDVASQKIIDLNGSAQIETDPSGNVVATGFSDASVFVDNELGVSGSAEIEITLLDTAGDGSGGVSSSGTISPSGNSLLLVVGVAGRGSRTENAITDVTDSLTGTGTWTVIEDPYVVTNGGHLWLTYAAWAIAGSSPGSGTISTSKIEGTNREIMQVYEVTGYNSSNPIVQSASSTDLTTGAHNVSLSLPSAPNEANTVMGIYGSENQSLDDINPGSTFTQISEVGASGSTNAQLNTEKRTNSTSTTVDWDIDATGSNYGAAMVGFEIGAASGGGDPASITSEWHHVVITDTTGINASAMDIGRVASAYFDGTLDDIRIYNRVLSGYEISRLYDLGATAQVNKSIETNLSHSSDHLAHWTFDGPHMLENVADSSGQGNHGSLQGQVSTSTSPGRIGQALEFDGVDDYVSVGSVNSGATARTIAFWINADDISSRKIIDIDGTDHIEIDGSANVTPVSFPSPTVYVDGSASSATISEGWHHVVITDETGVSLSAVDVGRVATEYFDGHLDDVHFYDTVLSSSEIQRLFDLGNTTVVNKTGGGDTNILSSLVGHWTFDGPHMLENVADSSGQGNHGSLQGQVSTSTSPGRIGQALEFDGVDDYVSITSSPVTGSSNRTVSFWVKRGSSNDERFVSWGDGSTGGKYSIRTDTNKLRVEIGGSGFTSNLLIPEGEWTFVALTLDGSTIGDHVLYVNDSSENSTGSDTINTSSSSMLLGEDVIVSSPFKGTLDDVRLYDEALSATEVQRLYRMSW